MLLDNAARVKKSRETVIPARLRADEAVRPRYVENFRKHGAASQVSELGAFLRSARARIQPESVGLARSSGRRVPGLRREDVAELIGVSESWYARFEAGRASMSLKSLNRLADALCLAEADRRKLLRLALPELQQFEEPPPRRQGMLNVGLWPGYRLTKSCAEPTAKIATALWTIRGTRPTALELAVPDDSYLFCLHLRGSMGWNASVGDRRIERPIVAGTLNMGFPGDRCDVEYREADLVALHVYVSRAMIDAYVRDAGLKPVEFVDPANRDDLETVAIGAAIVAEMNGQSDTMRLRIEGLGMLLLANVIDRWSNRARPDHERSADKADPKRLRNLMEFLDASAESGAGLADAAEAADLPLHFVSPWFERQTGASPAQWTSDRRTQEPSA